MGAFHEHGSHAGPTWPAAALDHNLPLRASCGLTALYAAVNRTRGPELAATAVAPPVKRLHETFPDGTLCLAPDMPLLARRYRFMHAISETDLSQVICATDTYCECERAADGRRQPLVAIKVLNAKHWIIGAQEYTRLRLLRKRQDAEGVHVPIAGATSCFEVGCHFCILQPLLATLDHEAARCRLCGPPGAAPSPPLAGRSPGSLESVERVDEATSLPPRLGLDVLRPLAARLLGALAYLRQHDVIHADLKPDNLMADRGGGGGGGGEVDLGNRVRLIDFSNAMTPAESKAYYDTFDVQTLGYRAPEVIFGAPFGFGIDMWSLGVTLCELFAGRYLLQAASRGGLAVQVAQLLGRPPQGLFDGAKYHAELHHLVAHQPPPLPPTQLRARLTERLGAPRSSQAQLFLDLVTGMLQYDPRRRLTPSEALCHPFLAPFFPWRATMPREVVAAADEKVFVEMRGPALDVQPEEPPLKKRLVGGRPLDAVTQIA